MKNPRSSHLPEALSPMSYELEHNPRMAIGRIAAPHGHTEVQRTNYTNSGRRIIQRSAASAAAANKKIPLETDRLTNEVSTAKNVSQFATCCYVILGYAQWFYTIALVILVGAQSNASLSVKALLFLMLSHSFITSLLLGMNQKINNLNVQSAEATYSSTALLRHVRDDRRKNLCLLSMLISAAASIDISYIARVASSWNIKAETFRSTGNNNVVDREMDTMVILVYTLTVPILLQFVTEASFTLQSQGYMTSNARVSSTPGDSSAYDADDDNLEIRSPKK